MRWLKPILSMLLLLLTAPAFAEEKPEDPDTARAMEIFRQLNVENDYGDSHELVRAWIETLEAEFGAEHPVLLKAYMYSGKTFHKSKDYKGAQIVFGLMYQLALKIEGPRPRRPSTR